MDSENLTGGSRLNMHDLVAEFGGQLFNADPDWEVSHGDNKFWQS